LRAMADGGGLGLENAYGATLDRIRAQSGAKSELAMTALMWICHSDRPLKVNELCHALAVEIGSQDFDIENVPLIGTLLNCCQGLITVDKEASTVRLVHHTLQEYLSSNPELFPRAHSTIAETCLTYLNSQRVKSLSPYPLPDLGDVPFLRYASLHWGTHAKKEFSNHAKSLALDVMDHYEDHISAILLLQEMVRRDFNYDNYKSSQCTRLHCASYFGILELAIALMETEGCDINKPDCSGLPPISWAAGNGHEALVKRLLEREDVNPDAGDSKGTTALF
jgi:ankyrin repeat protein